MDLESAYRALGLVPGAEEELVKAAYKARAKRMHPDVGGSDRAFKRIEGAFDLIRDAGFPTYGQGLRGDQEPAAEEEDDLMEADKEIPERTGPVEFTPGPLIVLSGATVGVCGVWPFVMDRTPGGNPWAMGTFWIGAFVSTCLLIAAVTATARRRRS